MKEKRKIIYIIFGILGGLLILFGSAVLLQFAGERTAQDADVKLTKTEQGFYFRTVYKALTEDGKWHAISKDEFTEGNKLAGYERSDGSFYTTRDLLEEVYYFTYVWLLVAILLIGLYVRYYRTLAHRPAARRWIYATASLVMIAFAILLSYDTILQTTTLGQTETVGKVKDIEREKRYGRFILDHFYIDYEYDISGESYLASRRVSFGTYDLYEAGQSIPVHYMNSNPGKSYIGLTTSRERTDYVGFKLGLPLFVILLVNRFLYNWMKEDEAA